MSYQTRPYKLDESRTRMEIRNALVSVLADSEQTGGSFNLLDVVFPPDFETQLLIHYSEDVAIYVLMGSLDIFWGDDKHQAQSGSYFFQPRGTPHGFRVKSENGAHILYMTFPAGFDKFVLEVAKSSAGIKPMVIAARYKIELLSPLPKK